MISRLVHQLKNSFIKQIIFFIFSMAIIFIINFCFMSSDYITIKKSRIRDTDVNVTYTLNLSDMDNENVILQGIILRFNSVNKQVRVLLVSKEGKSNIVLSTKQKNDEMVTNYFNPSFDFGAVSFETNLPINNLKEDVSYEIVLEFTYETSGEQYTEYIETSKYLWNNELYNYNPNDNEFVKPYFKDNAMKCVIEDGILMQYNKEYGAWIYLYENNLYWILDKTITSNLNENLLIFVYLYTMTQQLNIYNKDFIFSARELMTDEKYRVAKFPLEMDEPISRIWTGEYHLEMQKFIWSTWLYPLIGFQEEQ